MNKWKIFRIIKIFIPLMVVFLIYQGYCLYYYSLPWKDDFRLNSIKYMEIVNLLNTNEYADITSIGGWYIQFKGLPAEYYKSNNKIEEKYIWLEDRILEINNQTFFKKCPNWIIKISKGGWINRIFEVVYVYSKDGFSTLPHYMKEKINDHIITYHNYDSTYSASNSCNVK